MAHKKLGFMQVFIMCGFSMYYCHYMLMFFGFFLKYPLQSSFTLTHLGQIIFFACSVICGSLLLLWFNRNDDALLGKRTLVYIVTLIAGALPSLCALCVSYGLPVPLGVFYVACALGGASVACGFMMFEDLTMNSKLTRGMIVHGTIFSVGAVVFSLCILTLSLAQLAIVSIVLLFLSVFMVSFVVSRRQPVEYEPASDTRKYFKTVRHLDVVAAVISIAFGYAFMLAYNIGTQFLAAAVLIGAIADFAASYFLDHGHRIKFAGALRICCAVISCALIIYLCPGSTLQRVGLCLVIAFWAVFRALNGSSLIELAVKNNLSILYASTRGKLASNFGFTVGLAVGLFAIVYDTSTAYLYSTLGIIAAFIVAALFFLPFEEEETTPGYRTIRVVETSDDDDEQLSLEARCEIATQRFKLSPRESDVLVFVVRGRNASHIAEKLFISESTVKTHMSNLYRKCAVHSQQELIDLIDTF